MKRMNLLIGFLLLVLLHTIPANAGVLYGISLNGAGARSPSTRGIKSSLYRIDSTTGAGTLVGDIGFTLNSIAFDPTTGILYGSTTGWNEGYNGLITIDSSTGAGTAVGTGVGLRNALRSLAFKSNGELFG